MSRCACGARLADDSDLWCPLCQDEIDEEFEYLPEEEDQ